MARSDLRTQPVQAALLAEFNQEAHRLVRHAEGTDLTEGIMRLRALAEISARLPIEALLELAVAVSLTGRQGAQSRPRAVQ